MTATFPAPSKLQSNPIPGHPLPCVEGDPFFVISFRFIIFIKADFAELPDNTPQIKFARITKDKQKITAYNGNFNYPGRESNCGENCVCTSQDAVAASNQMAADIRSLALALTEEFRGVVASFRNKCRK